MYDRDPRYRPVGGDVVAGWAKPVAELRPSTTVLAIDGPWILEWERAMSEVCAELAQCGRAASVVDVRAALRPWRDIVTRTSSDGMLGDDPDFAPISALELSDLFSAIPSVPPEEGTLALVFGPGAALVAHDELWFLELPKRYAEAAILSRAATNLGQTGPGAGADGTTRRLFFIDWPILDRHRARFAPRIDRLIDTQGDGQPASIAGLTLRATLAALAHRPFRTRPTFNSTSWGGHWAEHTLGFTPVRGSTALGYELIAPESGIALGEQEGASVEVPLDLLVRQHPREILGGDVVDRFGALFPIRFDYLDTVGGGHLSVHCHPDDEDMRDVFGWPYGQHESYYVMVAGADGIIHLGLRDDADVEAFRSAAATAETTGRPFDIARFVQTFPATPHQLFLIPAGTPHGSGVGNVVLEISTTPYLYSLRFYDWLRRDTRGHQRPVHVDHAFRSLDPRRRGRAVARDLIPQPRVRRAGPGWQEEVIGCHPELFFEVARLDAAEHATVRQTTNGRFAVINLVDGSGAAIKAADGTRYPIAYAETMVIPAAVGEYDVEASDSRVRIVSAAVP